MELATGPASSPWPMRVAASMTSTLFGEVSEDMDVVKAIDALGSQDGETSKKVSVTDCGELELKDWPGKG